MYYYCAMFAETERIYVSSSSRLKPNEIYFVKMGDSLNWEGPLEILFPVSGYLVKNSYRKIHNFKTIESCDSPFNYYSVRLLNTNGRSTLIRTLKTLAINQSYHITMRSTNGLPDFREKVLVLEEVGKENSNLDFALPIIEANLLINYNIKKVIHNKESRIITVIWIDGTISMYCCRDGEEYDEEYGLALCFMKKALGNGDEYKSVLGKHASRSRAKETEFTITVSLKEK